MSASSSSSNFPAPAPSASSAPDHTYGGGFHLARASASEESLRDGNGNGSGSRAGTGPGRLAERRRAATLNAPDRKRRVRLVDSDTGDGDHSTTRAGAVVGEGSSRYAEPVASTTTASGSSFATPVDLTSSPPQPSQGNNYMECIRPRWQSDDEVTECPICDVPFSFWYRKHHCRKCGRVVCASCSPHRITIPRQYIVRPPDAYRAAAFASRFDLEDERAASPMAVNPALGGGEEVRLCNPCVPDPNPEPPRVFVQSPPRHRSYHSMSVPRSYGAFVGVPLKLRIRNEFVNLSREKARLPVPVEGQSVLTITHALAVLDHYSEAAIKKDPDSTPQTPRDSDPLAATSTNATSVPSATTTSHPYPKTATKSLAKRTSATASRTTPRAYDPNPPPTQTQPQPLQQPKDHHPSPCEWSRSTQQRKIV